MRQVAISCTLALLLGAGVARAVGPGGSRAAAQRSTCGTSCVAAYRAIARALPRDGTESLAHAIATTPGFDYARLSRALRIPTAAQLRADWRRRCSAWFPDDPSGAGACYRLILPSTYRRLEAIPALTA